MKEVLRLKEHVVQLRNVIAKQDAECSSARNGVGGREFDFRRFKRRHIALRLLYLGWEYEGFVVQENTRKTIERALFDALLKTKLIESRENSNYHRCGRTDVNVSAFSQVISIDVRTNLTEGRGVFTPEDYEPPTQNLISEQNRTSKQNRTSEPVQEVNYPKLLNQALPDNIRIISWAPVDEGFSARFDCTKRSYKYIFPAGDLDIERMREASKHLVGSHDFRNFCKFDRTSAEASTIRSIECVEIRGVNEDVDGYQVVELVIKSHAFLWHQIRCIVAVLMMIGERKEESGIIQKLLMMPEKPQYSLAPAFPLILFDCQFDHEKLDSWILDPGSIQDTMKRLQSQWTRYEVKAQMIRSCLNELQSFIDKPVMKQSQILITERSRTPKPLHQRPVCCKSTVSSLLSLCAD